MIAAEELAECLIAQGDYRAALPYLKMSVLIRDKMATAYSKMRNPRVYLELSYACTKLYRSADAETALNDAISHLSTLPEGAASSNPGMAYDGRQLSIAYALKGDLERFQAKWAASAQSYDKAEQVMKRSSFKKAGVFLNELALSRAFADLKGAHYQEASRYYEMVLPFAQEQFHGQRELQFVLDNYAYAAFHKGDWLKALTLKEQSLNLSQTVAR